MLQTTHAPVMPYSDMMKDDTRWTLLQETYNCKTHGNDENACYAKWSDNCDVAKYGFACACGHIGHNIATSNDMMHDELCCGRMICDSTFCYTHENF